MPGRPLNSVLPCPRQQWNGRVWLTSGADAASTSACNVSYLAGRKHLPIVELKKAAA